MRLNKRRVTYLWMAVMVILLSFACVKDTLSQTFNFHPTEASEVATGNRLYMHGFPDTLTVWCNDWDFILSNITTWGDDIKLKSNSSFVKFYVDNFSSVTKYASSVNYNYQLSYQLTGYPDPSDTITNTVTNSDTLTINFNNDDINNPYQDLNLKKYSNFYKIRIIINQIYRDSSGLIVPVILADTTRRNFAVEASILTQHYDKKEYGMGSGTSAPVVSTTPYPHEKYLDINWSFSSGAVTPINYELEWTYIDDYGVTLPGGTEAPLSFADLQFNFRFNSTKVWLSDTSYKIPLVYPRGYLVYRVRAVRPDSVLFKYPVYGNWSIPGPDEGPLYTLAAGFYNISEPYAGDSLNWQYTASFAEGGRYKNVATFYDGLLKNRQSITRLNSNFGKLIATGNVYDHEGRLCIKSLPAPIDVPSFTYQYNLLLNSVTSLPYKAADFDTGSLRFSLIPPLAANALANIYYSPNNPDTLLRHQKFVADAGGYPMVQTIFESGSQDRVLAQSGAGFSLQIGNPNYVSNSYVGVAQPLINSLFGPNVGWENFYTMTVSRDPNQQLSMTVNDYHGKPMVSALIGDGPAPAAYAIDQVNVPDSNYTRQDLLSSPSAQAGDVQAGRKIADVDYFSEAHSTDSLQYFYTFTPFQACPGQYLSVKGHYRTTITDQYGDVMLTEDSTVGSSAVSSSSAAFAYAGPVGHFPAHVGPYHVNKTLSFAPWETEAVLDSFFRVADCFLQLPYFVRQSVTAETFPCPGEPPGTPAYDSNDCLNKEWFMMQQLFPNAAYGKYNISDGIMTSTPNSIYTIFCDCYHAFALYGEDTSLVVSSQGPRGIVNYRAPFTEIAIPDTCVADTLFTNTVTIKAFGLFDSTQSVYMPFMGENGRTGDTAMVGYYRIHSNWNLGSASGNIYEGGVVVGHISQHPSVFPALAPDTTIFTLPVSVNGNHFFANLHANVLSAGGDSLFFTFSGQQADPYAHSPSWESPYVDWTHPGCMARYQDTCLLPDFPDTITVNGVHYSALRDMDHVAFNAMYTEAVAAGNYTIARALLPLHPQYCELQNCFPDTFRTTLSSLGNWNTAQAMGLMLLDSIVAHDPLKGRMAATGLFPSPADSLLTFRGGGIRLDSFIFMQAYCSCRDSIMFAACANDMFSYEISHHLLVNDQVKQFYFSNILGIYLGNRQRFVDSAARYGGNTCGPCSVMRMRLDSNAAIFPYTFKIDTPVVLFPGGDTVNWITGIFSDDMEELHDSIALWYHETDSLLGSAAIDTIMAHLGNCFDASALVISTVRSSLLFLVSSGAAPKGSFTNSQIYKVLRDAGITPDDLCNPYTFNFPGLRDARPEDDCLAPAFYDNIAGFLADTAVLNRLRSPGSGWLGLLALDTLHGRAEREIARRLGNIQGVSVWAEYSTASKLYTVSVFDTSGGTDTVKIMLRSPICADFFSTLGAGAYTISATCINSFRGGKRYGPGLVNQYSFITRIESGGSDCYLTGWIDSVKTMDRPGGPIARCVPCTRMRALYAEFRDTMQVYGVKGADHPLYRTMLANFMNQALVQQYTASDYETFIQSCAIADSVTMPLYVGYATFKFGSPAIANSFISTLNAVDLRYDFSDSYRDSIDVGGLPEITVCVDLNKVPEGTLRRYRDVLRFEALAPTAISSAVNDPYSTLRPPGEIGFIYTDPAYPFSPADSSIVDPSTGITFSLTPYQKAVWIAGRFEMRDFYDVVQTGATAADVSRAIYNITAYIYNHNTPGVVFTPGYQSTIDADYFKPEKQAYLQYVYDFQQLPDYEVLSKLQAASLVANIPSYAGYKALYSRETVPGLFSNLYLWDAGMNTRYFDTLQRIIDLASPSGAGDIFNAAASVPVPVAAPAQLDAYLSSDRSYWYRYFTTGDTLFNVWLGFPDRIPAYLRPAYRVAGRVIPMPGDSLNRHFALSVTIPGSGDTLLLNGLSSFVIGSSIELDNVLMRKGPLSANAGADTFENCERQRLNSAIRAGVVNYNNYMDSVRAAISGAFRDYVVNNTQESLLLGYTTNKKFFTVYNYDRAGNLTFTIPPAGLVPIPAGPAISNIDTARLYNTPGLAATPTINKINRYTYTTFNQLRSQSTINGGTTRFMYDAAGRLVFSQNAKQATTGDLTYNIYDEQGRIIETGEGPFGCPYFDPYTYASSPVGSTPGGGSPVCSTEHELSPGLTMVWPYPFTIVHSDTVAYSNIVAFIRSHKRRDVVYTTYDSAAVMLDTIRGHAAQENLRKRIGCVMYLRTLDTGTWNGRYDYATHYSYDPQGNVKTLTHDYPLLQTAGRRYVRIDYDYDVISGKVNMLSYNRGKPDQFYQKYDYDADNRITEVNTSNDGYIWRQDARYTYYEHGPLARAELGDLRVQGLDYAYTIQGWLKAVNGDTLNTAMEMGEDGLPGIITGRDAVAHTIDYFSGDYQSITGRTLQHTPTPTRNLYNGNIVGQTVAIDTFRRLHKAYVYDQLNRILSANYATVDLATGALTGISDYRSNYAYDPDGNLTALRRWGNNTGSGAVVMDSLSYVYPSIHHDKLEDVLDSASNAYSNEFMRHTTPTVGGRYLYDPIGNLRANLESGQDTIEWNLYNKVTRAVNNADTSWLEYDYDGMGNRVGKHYIKFLPFSKIIKSEYYIRDAQGNILGTYKGLFDDNNTGSSHRDFSLVAHDIYGSSRLGQKNYFGLEIGSSIDYGLLAEGLRDTVRLLPPVPWYSLEQQDVMHPDSPTCYGSLWQEMSYAKHVTGARQYEVADHLGNVLATLSDKRAGGVFAGTLTPGTDVEITAWKPVVAAEYDYYPFGQYMPGRYTVDTATHCLTTTLSGMGHAQVMRNGTATGLLTAYGPAGVYISSLTGGSSSLSSGSMSVVATAAGGGATITYTPVSVYGNKVQVIASSITGTHRFGVTSAGGAPLGSLTVTPTASPVVVDVPITTLPHSATVVIFVECITASGGSVNDITFKVPFDTVVPCNIVSNVCNGGGYRYGYNGKIKDNEWAGVGNHYDYGFRRYDPRLGRFTSVDPLTGKFPMLTPYQFSSNTPIWAKDLDGLEAYYTNDGTFMGFGKVKGEQAPVILVTNVDGKDVSQEEALTFKGVSVVNGEFEQYAGMVYNEVYGGKESAKQEVADAIFNKKEGLKKDYPGIKNASLQQTLDKVAYSKDSKEQRMSDARGNPGPDDRIPGTVSKTYPDGIPLKNISAKNYQKYMKTTPDDRNKDPEMKTTNKTVIKALQRDNGKRTEDKANGKSHWRGDGKKNHFY